jgi:hypothetical protein
MRNRLLVLPVVTAGLLDLAPSLVSASRYKIAS